VNSFFHVIVHKIRQIDNLAICYPCNVVFNCFGNVAHTSVSWFWTSSWSGFKSGSKVTFSFLLQSEPMLDINKGINKFINNLPTISHIFRKLVREHTCLVCSIKRIKNTHMGRVLIYQNVITYLDWNFKSFV